MGLHPDIHNNHTIKDISLPLSEKKANLEIKKNRIVRILYLIGGTLSLAFAILGIVVPGLPTTPFALLAAFLYAKSSHKLHNKLLNNKILGPRIKNYHRRKGVTRTGKLGAIAFMTIMVLISSFVVFDAGIIRYVILSMGLVGGIVVWFFVPTAKNE